MSKIPKRNHINEKQLEEIQKAHRQNKNKYVEKRLQALLLHAEGKNRTEISEVTYFTKSYISELVSRYCHHGIGAFIGNKHRGNRKNMGLDEEKTLQ